jgi:hypothetical protein
MLLCLLCGSSFIAHWFTINAIILRPITKMVHWSEWLINCVLQHINSTVVKRHLWLELLGVVNEDVVSTYHEGNCSMWLLAEMSAQCDIRVLMISMTCEVHGHYSVRLTRTIASGEGTDAPYQLRWLILSVTYDKDGCMLSGVANEAACPDACSECNARNDARGDSRWRIQVHCVGTHLYIFAGHSNLPSLYSLWWLTCMYSGVMYKLSYWLWPYIDIHTYIFIILFRNDHYFMRNVNNCLVLLWIHSLKSTTVPIRIT